MGDSLNRAAYIQARLQPCEISALKIGNDLVGNAGVTI
jgi:hypothetical protein